MRVHALAPHLVRASFKEWQDDGASLAVLGARFRVLRSALGWAYDEGIVDSHPLRLMRGPGRPPPRRPLGEADVRVLLTTAEIRLLEAQDNHHEQDPVVGSAGRLHRAEQDLLLARLAADTGARRGELAALGLEDLQGRVLRIERAVSAGQLTTPKSGHGRTLTVGATTSDLWHQLVATWDPRAGHRSLGPWLFASDAGHHHRVGSEVLGHRFANVRDAAHVPDATLHRLRHSVATFLVGRGQVLQAQARLGHADAATTLREYAHALPLTDDTVADSINDHLNHHPEDTEAPPKPTSWTP